MEVCFSKFFLNTSETFKFKPNPIAILDLIHIQFQYQIEIQKVWLVYSGKFLTTKFSRDSHTISVLCSKMTLC